MGSPNSWLLSLPPRLKNFKQHHPNPCGFRFRKVNNNKPSSRIFVYFFPLSSGSSCSTQSTGVFQITLVTRVYVKKKQNNSRTSTVVLWATLKQNKKLKLIQRTVGCSGKKKKKKKKKKFCVAGKKKKKKKKKKS